MIIKHLIPDITLYNFKYISNELYFTSCNTVSKLEKCDSEGAQWLT